MNDKLCDKCHKEYPLKLTSEYEMLCHLCMDNKFAVPLIEVLDEIGSFEKQQEAMKRLWEDIDKLGDKDE